jgi:hypothetical protein
MKLTRHMLILGLASAGLVAAAGGCRRPAGATLDTAGGAAELPETRIALVESPMHAPFFEVSLLSLEEQLAIEAAAAGELADVVRVHVADAADDVPAVAGEVSRVESVAGGSGLRFTPRYPLRPGMRYRVEYLRSRLFGDASAADDLEEEFELPAADASPASVAHIYPSADRLPENQLKFYLHFSAPMSRGEAYQHVRLLDADGQPVADPFLELGEELWDPAMQRFTLLFDPGRIKRGLKPREEVGPVLEEGKRYTLVVDRQWPSAAGQPLEADARKEFEVLPPDDAPLDYASWKIEPPKAGTSDPLVVHFGEPLDQAMLERVVRVVDAAGQPVSGAVAIAEQETQWRFTPQMPWVAGDYRLVADTTLEDLAGNSIGRAFDVDVFAPVEKQITTETVSVPFAVAAP